MFPAAFCKENLPPFTDRRRRIQVRMLRRLTIFPGRNFENGKWRASNRKRKYKTRNVLHKGQFFFAVSNCARIRMLP